MCDGLVKMWRKVQALLLFWLALSRDWRNEALHGYDGDSFPHSLLRASQFFAGKFFGNHLLQESKSWMGGNTTHLLMTSMLTFVSGQIPKGRLVKGTYKPICRDCACAIYFSVAAQRLTSYKSQCDSGHCLQFTTCNSKSETIWKSSWFEFKKLFGEFPHPWGSYGILPSFKMKIKHSCRYIYQSPGCYDHQPPTM